MSKNKSTHIIEAINKESAIKKLLPELKKRNLTLIKSSIKRRYPNKVRTADGTLVYVYEYDVYNKNIFKESDFTISKETHDIRIAYIFQSHDVIANYFWEIGKEPRLHGLVGNDKSVEIRYPLPVQVGQKIPSSKAILTSLIQKLNRGEYD